MLAERWLGIGSVVVAVAGIAGAGAGFALRPSHHRHHHAMATSALQLAATHCSGTSTMPSAPVNAPPQTIDQVMTAARPEVAECLTTSNELQMLMTVAADGRVIAASHRPEKETAETRCVAKVLLGLQFPASRVGTTVRFSLRNK